MDVDKALELLATGKATKSEQIKAADVLDQELTRIMLYCSEYHHCIEQLEAMSQEVTRLQNQLAMLRAVRSAEQGSITATRRGTR